MPVLDWIGKEKVVNHHMDVPFHVLDKKYTFGCESDNSENKIIHGDNLLALKSLLPQYEGRIKCIYIDPPYNTGNEGWVYNDNVNDPRILKWLGEVVGKEGEDLSRHDKWLCMMYPRLKLLHRLLADDGAIFISIDDNEQANLKLICDEIFGAGNFVSDISWQRTYSTRNDSKGIVVETEHILVYSKQPNWQPNKLPRTAEMNKKYKNPDNDISDWTSDNPFAPGAATHQGMVYAIQHPFTGEMIYPSSGACWRYQQEEMLNIMNGWCPYILKDLGDAAERARVCGISPDEVRKGVMGIVLAGSLEESKKRAKEVLKRGQWPRFYFTKNGLGGIRRKTYLSNVSDIPPTNFFPYLEVGHTDEAKKALLAILGKTSNFDTPKPARLIERILQIASDKDSIILDSFAGSGTTAHAVLNLNKADGGNRKFILIEMMDYAEDITAERVRRVIKGYGEGKKAVEGTEGEFSYYELGEPLLIDGNINEQVDIDKLREYIYFTETRQLLEPARDEEKYYLGTYLNIAYYFCYEQKIRTTLDHELLVNEVRTRADGYVIYADSCTLSDEQMRRYNIIFRKIPRDITKI
ncbi:MAG: site-specific DNA-methyltransferase [Anaerovibrio sp.]|uniref:site-specific DNA-methyltransferase n=1 Tax=Anaerovibrio sp. TaxID=1872532 RepID=UPI001B1977C0|nr:site-specific DNA-methyltransferase [Anaerovibrio sp.]MBO6245190.1 site-specific DNA-methyltransferase [Anaerovibrio sp.]